MAKGPQYTFKKDEKEKWWWLCPICLETQGPFDSLGTAQAAASLHNFKH